MSLLTLAERSGWRKTGRYPETLALAKAFQKAFRGRVRAREFGLSAEGRPLIALAASDDGALTPEACARRRRPVVLFQGCIHPGEVDGKDAGFQLLRQLLAGETDPGLLRKVTAVFVPVFSPDGHERFGPHHRPNQNGPEEMGWRVTAQNLNLNRDYVKAESPEMQAMLRLLAAWDPILYADLHATDGAKFEHDIAVILDPTNMGAEGMRGLGVEMRDRLRASLEKAGHLPVVEFYPNFNKKDHPESGFSAWGGPPRFSNSYWPLRNRFAALVETHSWKDYATRVRATRAVVLDLLRQAAERGARWRAAASAADAADRRGEPARVPLAFKPSARSRTIEFRGCAYEAGPSELSGQRWIRYDDKTPQVWRVPFHGELEETVSATVPAGGYVVPVAWAPLVSAKLALHGFSWKTLKRGRALEVEAFRATSVARAAISVEGRQTAAISGRWAPERRAVPAGSLYVPARQPGRRLLAHLLDPRGPDSLASWGWFNVMFEQREYMEDYLIEEVARRRLASEPALKAEFEERLKDPAFAASPQARLWFFYERDPSFDETKDLYPVYRVARAP